MASKGGKSGAGGKGGSLTPAGRTIPASTFGFLFAEFVAYHQQRSASMVDLEARMDATGYGIGLRLLETVALKERPGRRETAVVPMLQFVSSVVWQHLFGKTADALEKSTEHANSYMIREAEPITNIFISVPKDRSRFNPASFVGGILRGILDGAGFPCTVQAVTQPLEVEAGPRDKTVFLIKFADIVAAREASGVSGAS